MDQRHISRQEWTALFSTQKRGADWTRLKFRVEAHAGICPQCRALYEKGTALQEAARALAAADMRAAPISAYRAVASSEAPSPGAPVRKGSLCVCVDSGTRDAAFIEDTLEAEGCANKYAMNLEAEGRCLLDDDDALRLEVRNGQLLAALGDGEPACECRLLSEDEEPAQARLEPGGQVALELPPDSFCTLELVFGAER